MLNYAIIFNAVSNGMAITELDTGTIADVNDAWVRATGVAREASIGTTALELNLWCTAADREACIAEIERCGRLVDFEIRLNMKSVEIPHLVSAQIVDLNDKRHVLWEFRDISRQKKNEMALRASEQKLTGILDNVDAYIYLKDTEGRYLFANRPVRELWHAQMEDIVGFGDEKFFDATTTANIRHNDKLVLEQGLTVREEETNTVPATGETFTYLSTKLPLRCEDGSIYALCGISTDITVRRHAEDTLRANEQRLRTIIETEPECIKVVNDLGQLVEMNTAGLLLLEADSLAEAQSQPLLEYVLPEYRDAFMALHTRVMNGEPAILAFEITGLKGTRRLLETHAAPLRDAASNIVSVLGVTRDITERKQHEEALRKNASRFQMAIENSRMLIWELDLVHNELRYDDAALNLLGIATDTPPHTLEGWLAMIHPDDHAPFFAEFQASSPPGGRSFDLEYRCATHSEQWRWVHTRGEFIQHDVQGNPILAVGSTMNINERKLAEMEVQIAKDRFELIFNSNPDVMVISRLSDGLITNVNDAFARYSGYSKAEAIGQSTVGLSFWLSEERHKMIDAIARDGCCRNMEFEFTARNGQIKFGSLSAVITPMQGMPHLVSTVHDITQRKLAEFKLQQSETLLRSTLEATDEGILMIGHDGSVLSANQRFMELWHVPAALIDQKRDDLLIAHVLEQLTEPEAFLNLVKALYNSDEEARDTLHFKDGRVFERFTKALFIGHERGRIWCFRNISDIFKAQLQLQIFNDNLAMTLKAIPDLLFEVDQDGLYLNIFAHDEALLAQQKEHLLGHRISDMLPPEAAKICMSALHEARKNGYSHGQVIQLELTGGVHWFELSTAYKNSADAMHRFIMLSRDITERKKSEGIIWMQANYDSLTKLPNRRMFLDRLAQDIKKTHRNGEKLALFFLDLDHFKEVNDSLGHEFGDMLLVEVSRRISQCVRESDTVARLGGDEFTVILNVMEDSRHIEQIAEKIIHVLNQPFDLQGNAAYVTASIGITLYPDDALNVDDMLKNADQAMFVSKRAGRNRFGFFTSSMQESAQHRLQIISDLRTAIAEQQFQLFFQPIIEFKTGKLHKAEALIRWFHPTCGLISPADFIPLAEESGLIHEIGDWVFAEALKQAQHWRTLDGPDFQISVNMSPVQMQVAKSQKQWFNGLEKLDLSGQNFVFEITEGLLLDTSSNVTDQLLAFRDAGIQVAIDDFGTGYSALAYLKKMDIDYLKIDQSFTRNLAPDSSDLALSEAIIVMAHKLGLKVIAEGVETEAQHQLLSAIGCDYGQGYYYSRPVDKKAFEALLMMR